MMAPHQVREIVGRLSAAYPDPPMSDETAVLYKRMLEDLEYEQVDPAVDELIATVMRLPTVSRIRRAVIEPTLGLPSAEQAWSALQERQELHELARHAATLMGGGFNLRTSANPELTRLRFVKLYEDLRRRVVDDALAAGIRARRLKLAEAS